MLQKGKQQYQLLCLLWRLKYDLNANFRSYKCFWIYISCTLKMLDCVCVHPTRQKSSLNCSIWHSFCSFFYSQVWSDHVHNTKEQKLLSGLLFPGRGKNLSFSMTARVAQSTHGVLLAMNVILVKECEKSNSPTP